MASSACSYEWRIYALAREDDADDFLESAAEFFFQIISESL